MSVSRAFLMLWAALVVGFMSHVLIDIVEPDIFAPTTVKAILILLAASTGALLTMAITHGSETVKQIK